MPWPLSQDYNEAIQTPTQCFSDPELQRGEAVTNELGLPMPCSGNFADVYAIQAGQQKWAVKCFTRQIQGLRDRYTEISKYLQQVQLPFMVEFRFLDQGIRVRGQWYPILKMQWVEGLALNAFVRANLENPAILQSVCQIWVRMATRLREANLAHGDLQHGNVLLVPGPKAGTAGVKLVDYDGMCVPALEFLKATEVGHPAYQHPQRLREASYGLHIDNFSHLVIYTALRALTVGGKKLWDRFDNGDNLLFSQKDFENPNASPVFKELLAQSDGEVRKLTGVLAEAARQSVKHAPLLESVLLNEARPKTAIPKQAAPKTAEPNPFVPPDTPARARKKGGKGVLVAVLIGCLAMAGAAVGAFLLSQPPPSKSPVAVNDTRHNGTATPSKAISIPSVKATAPNATLPASTKCALTLEIEPGQTDVFLDGKLVSSASPKEVTLDVLCDKHDLKVAKTGFKEHKEALDLTESVVKRIRIKLEPAPQAEWTELFNGKNLTGWTTVNKDAANYWAVRDGLLVNHASGPTPLKTAGLYTVAEFDDFELELEFRLPARCNSGVYLRGRYEVQLLDSEAEKEARKKQGAKFDDKQICGAIYGHLAPTRNAYLGTNQWNTLKVRLKDYQVTVSMNGHEVTSGVLDAPTGAAMFPEKGSKGPIMLQSHLVSGGQFRNIRLRPIQ